MIPRFLAIDEQYAGDTYGGIQIACSRTDSEGVTTIIDLTTVTIRMHIKKGYGGTPLKILSVGSGITKTDAVNGVLTIDAFTNLEGGVYIYDLEFTYASGVVQTYLKGTYTVEKQITE